MTTFLMPIDELPGRLRMLAADVHTVGGALAHYGGVDALGDCGRELHDVLAPLLRDLAAKIAADERFTQ